MKNSRLFALVILMPLFLFTVFLANTEASSPACSAETRAAAAKSDSASPIKITLKLLEAGLETGINLRVSFENSGPDALSLSVCPAMLLCCVKGLHPLVTCEDTGVGLLDVCQVSKPTSHEVYLPVHSTFSFDLNIPPDRLPAECIQKGRQVSVCLFYEMDDEQGIRSNAVGVVMH